MRARGEEEALEREERRGRGGEERRGEGEEERRRRGRGGERERRRVEDLIRCSNQKVFCFTAFNFLLPNSTLRLP
jgi:hypothetical protein